jgi:hypothetical protein
MKIEEGSGGTAPCISTFDMTWRLMVSFTPCHFVLGGGGERSPWCSLDRRLGGPEANLDAMEKRKLFLLMKIEPQFLGCSPHSIVTIVMELSQPLSIVNNLLYSKTPGSC